MTQAQQRLGADDLAAARAHDGLVVELEVLAQPPLAQRPLEGERLARRIEPRGVPDLRPPAAGGLGATHRRVGLAQQHGGLHAVCRAERGAETGFDPQLVAADLQRLPQPLEDRPGPPRHARGVAAAGQQQRELVGAEARHRLPFRDALQQAVGDRRQHLVARLVPAAVVDRLEAVEVERQQGARPVAAAQPGQPAAQPLDEELPVGQAGHRVVEGQPLDLARRLAQPMLLLFEQPDHDADAEQAGEQAVERHLDADRDRRQPADQRAEQRQSCGPWR